MTKLQHSTIIETSPSCNKHFLSNSLPIARYRFHWLVDRDITLPDYSGSTLRGVFGNSLRFVSCMTKQPICQGCALLRTCPYTDIFESPPPEQEHHLQKFSQVPNPYIIEPPSWGQKTYHQDELLNFDLVLVGSSLKQLPLIIYAWQKAFERGVGKGDGTAQLFAVELVLPDQTTHTIFAPLKGIDQVQPHLAQLDWQNLMTTIITNGTVRTESQFTHQLMLNLSTPLRLQENGHALPPNKLSANKLLMTLVRRVHLLLTFHDLDHQQPSAQEFTELAQQAHLIESNHEALRWLDWQRYSNRQKKSMSLGGVVGDWILTGDLTPFLPYLILGQWLHIGKNATFGLGKYQLVPRDSHHYIR